MTQFQAKIVAALLLGVFFLVPLRCVIWADDVQACARNGLLDMVLIAVPVWTFANAIWLGVEAGKRSGKQWVGWIAGILVFLVLIAMLSWLEVPNPSTDFEGDEDNSYRR